MLAAIEFRTFYLLVFCLKTPVVLYGCETWSLTLMVKQKLKVFENMVLRRIFGLKRDDVIGGRRKLHKEEPHNLYALPNTIIKSRRMTWTGDVAHIGRRGMHAAFWCDSHKERDH
jgi:hypothetical protein